MRGHLHAETGRKVETAVSWYNASMTLPDEPDRLFPGPSSPDAEVVTLIVRLLQAEEWEIRATAAKELGRRRALQALDALCTAVTDRVWHVRPKNAPVRYSGRIASGKRASICPV